MSNQYLLPDFHFIIQWDGGTYTGSFSEASGLTQDSPADAYHGDSLQKPYPTKVPGSHKHSNITLKHGIAKSDLLTWLSAVKRNATDRRNIIVCQLDGNNTPVKKWKVHNAYPVKFAAPNLNAKGNTMSIETIEIAHEGIELQNN